MGHESELWGSCLATLWGQPRDGGSLSHRRSQGFYLLFCSRGGVGRETRRAWAQGHQQHQVSFHLYKDSLTPEHINTLNDRERSWDSRPAPPLLLPSPPLPSGPIFFLFFAFSLLSVPLCLLSVLPLLSLLPLYLVLVSSFPSLPSPLLRLLPFAFPSPHSNCIHTNPHPAASDPS